MSKYFNYFPKTIYTSNDSGSVDLVTNITSRFAFGQELKENTSVYYKYDIKDSDTPEIIAAKMYGSAEKHWVVLMLNNIVDPQFDWPLQYDTLIKYINAKYANNAVANNQTGLEWAGANSHSYYKIETRTTDSTGSFLETKLELDSNTYANVQSTITNITLGDGNAITITISKEPKSYYEYEIEENEKKRTINILKPEFVTFIEDDLKKVFNFN